MRNNKLYKETNSNLTLLLIAIQIELYTLGKNDGRKASHTKIGILNWSRISPIKKEENQNIGMKCAIMNNI